MVKIEVEDVTVKGLVGQLSLDQISAKFNLGELALITGPAAAGKSLLLKVISGRQKKDSGRLNCWGAKLCYLPEQPQAYLLGETARQQLLLASCKDPEATLDSFGILGQIDCPLRLLSSTSLKLLSFAYLSSLDSDFILLDEPFANLDYHATKLILQWINAKKKQKKGLIIASKEVEKILAHVDRVILLKEGRLILDALPERVMPYFETHGIRTGNLKLKEMTW